MFFLRCSNHMPSEQEYIPVKKRRALEEEERLKKLGYLNALREGIVAEETLSELRNKESLLVTSVRAKKDVPEATNAEIRFREEQSVFKQITTKQALKSVKELAKVKPSRNQS